MEYVDSSDILKLSECLSSDSCTTFQTEAIQIIVSKTEAEAAFFLVLSEDQKELICNVFGNKVFSDEVSFNVENSCFQDILEKKISSVKNQKQIFCEGINNAIGVEIHSLLCVPLFDSKLEEKVFSLLCIINKPNFTNEDVVKAKNLSKFISPMFLRLWSYEKEQFIRKQSQSLLQVVKTLLIQIDNISLLLKEIMAVARRLTGAERCSLFLVDKEENELVAKVFDGNYTDDGNVVKDIRIPITEGIAGNVAQSGEILNINDAYSHPLFYRKMDEETGFKTRSILCFPIKDDKSVIGVAELCNKVNGSYFTHLDEEIANAFSAYCAICIMHSLMWKKTKDAHSRNRLSNGLIMHSTVSEEEILILANKSSSVKMINNEFVKFSFIPRLLTDTDAVHATVEMFEDLGMVQHWKIPKKALTRFVVTVKQGYRDPPYHNWMHGFSVAHFSYLLLKNFNLMGNQLSYLEGLALFVACLGHDLDHRGTTSSFHVTSKSVLAALYSSEGSVLERHHFAQTMAILHKEKCNILDNLTEKEYTKCLDYIRNVILATDLAHHFRTIKDIKRVLEVGYDSTNEEHHSILLCLMVTCSDLSDQTKNWANTKEIAKLIYKEFFTQGDLEKSMGVKPPDMMDRDKAHIPQLQIQFLQQVVTPVYKLLCGFFPELSHIVDTVKKHEKQWEKVEELFLENFSEDFTSKVTPLEFLDDERVDAAASSVQ